MQQIRSQHPSPFVFLLFICFCAQQLCIRIRIAVEARWINGDAARVEAGRLDRVTEEPGAAVGRPANPRHTSDLGENEPLSP